jgi:hypothetical protein
MAAEFPLLCQVFTICQKPGQPFIPVEVNTVTTPLEKSAELDFSTIMVMTLLAVVARSAMQLTNLYPKLVKVNRIFLLED